MKKVLILVDNAKRDLLVCKLLERSLVKQNLKVILCHKRNVHLKFIQEMPDAFIVSRSDYPYVVKAAHACKVFVYPGEGGRLTKESALGPFIGYSKESLYDVSFLTRAYLWGNKIQDWLLETGYFKEQQLKVVGNNKLDVYLQRNHQKKPVQSSKKFTLGIAFTAKATSTYQGTQNFVKTYYDYSVIQDTRLAVLNEGYDLEEYVWRDHAVLRIIITTIRFLLETTNICFSIRVGPFENQSHYDFLQKLFPSRIIIEDGEELIPVWIDNVDAVMTCWSTIGLEVIANKKPVISIAYSINNDHLFKSFKFEANGFKDIVPCYYTPKNIQETVQLIQDLQTKNLDFTPNQEAVKAILGDIYNWPRNDLSSDLIAADIKNILSQTDSEKHTQKEFYSVMNPRILKYFHFLPFSISLPLALIGTSANNFIKDVLSGNYVGNRHHFTISNKKIKKILHEL